MDFTQVDQNLLKVGGVDVDQLRCEFSVLLR
jgi:hypothetical protein